MDILPQYDEVRGYAYEWTYCPFLSIRFRGETEICKFLNQPLIVKADLGAFANSPNADVVNVNLPRARKREGQLPEMFGLQGGPPVTIGGFLDHEVRIRPLVSQIQIWLMNNSVERNALSEETIRDLLFEALKPLIETRKSFIRQSLGARLLGFLDDLG